MTDASKAVFLSYASQDADAARRICEALRAAGVEVWFDQSELRGGDAWDAKIRKQIKECALFVPIISANTQARREGYFRLEWRLAAQRTHLMSEQVAFLLPVVIDATRDAEADVPAEFRTVQWTRLPPGQTLAEFCARIQMLLGRSPGSALPADHGGEAALQPARRATVPGHHRRGTWAWLSAASLVALVAALWGWSHRTGGSAREPALPTASSNHRRDDKAPAQPPRVPPAPQENEKSLVVLPLENLSPDPENAFFTEGMHSEIISTLSRMSDLKVISRNSSNAFKGSAASLGDIAQKLGVANVITGSVRRAGNQVRIQLELRRARDEALLWAQEYSKGLEDVFAVQTEIADEVARVLQARDRRGRNAGAQLMTKNARAYDLFLKAEGTSIEYGPRADEMLAERIGELEEALRLDPNFVSAAGRLSGAYTRAFGRSRDSVERVQHAANAKKWGETASRLMPGGAGDGALAYYYSIVQPDNARALALGESAVRALPNEVIVLNYYAIALSTAGRSAEAVEYFRRALQIEPIAGTIWSNLAISLARLRRTAECAEAIARGIAQGNVDVARGDRVALIRYIIAGELPKTVEDLPAVQRALWLGRGRRHQEQLATIETALAAPKLADLDRFALTIMHADTLRALRRDAAAADAARDALALAEKLRTQPAVDRSEGDGRLAVALARGGRMEEALATGVLYVEAASASNQVASRRAREIELAELYAYFGRARDCVELLAKLLQVPSGITVPMLRVDPAWDKVRDDPAFKALLAEPKNSAPL